MKFFTSNRIKLKHWKFKSGEVTKLIWIGDPYNVDGKWMVDGYFKSLVTGNIVKHSVDWGTLAILKIGELYVDGKEIQDKKNIDKHYLSLYNSQRGIFDFDGKNFAFNIKEYSLQNSIPLKLKSFIYKYGDWEYHIPIIEIVRSILAKNKRLLYAILEPNSLDEYFRYTYSGKNLILESTGRYPDSLLRKKEHVIYLDG